MPEHEEALARSKRKDDSERFSGAVIAAAAVYTLLIVGVVLITCQGHGDAIGLSFAVVFAGATLGVVVGFTFGIPKAAKDQGAELTPRGRMVANSNFGKVSDWLTTIVVGLGIAQFGDILDGMRWLGNSFSDVFASVALGSAGAATYGLALVLSSIGIGFVLMFMWTSVRYLRVAAQNDD